MSRGKEEALKQLNELNILFDEKSFIDRVRGNDLEIVNLFLRAGMSPNEAYFDGSPESWKTAPRVAVEKGHIQMLKLLLKNDNTLAIDAFAYAAMVGQQDIVEELFEEAIKKDTHQILISEALRSSAGGGYLNILKMLLERGIDINLRSFETSTTALMCAAGCGQTEVVKYLLEMGANPNLLNIHSESALMQACFRGHFDIVELLINAGADLEIKDEEGKSALMIAQEEGHQEVVELIKTIYFRLAFICNKLQD